jgi:hypothetical protein
MNFVARSIALTVLTGVGMSLAAAPSAAQGYYTPPGGSPFSPYLELYRPNPGLLNQYYQFMIPRVQLRETLNQQQASLNALNTQIRSVQTQLRPQPAPVIGPTGVGAGYMSYSHFYSGSPGVGRSP